ncbi:UNVERIFIED_CONTAM: hypothetical protein GTU68_063388 [Idotea baltica]|nr:hypothetical protein [Idotea baltica]
MNLYFFQIPIKNISKMHLISCLKVNLIPRASNLINYSKSFPLKGSYRNFRKNASREGGMNLAPKVNTDHSHYDQKFSTFMKCFTFTAGFCGTTFIGASIWHYENIKSHLKEKNVSDWIKTKWNEMEGYQHKQGDFRKSLNKYWNDIPEGRKIFWTIFMANFVVFVCWRIPILQSSMMRYFTSSPAAKIVCWPMLLSTFSHYSTLHLVMNMYVLHSFSGAIGNSLGKEQFVGFYLAGGVFSSFLSQFFKLMTNSIGPSLGASGAIMALLGYFCTKHPDAQLGVIFLPNYPFSAELALKGVMLMDLSGLIFRWKLFDHAAHLGGAAFGLLYAKYGQSLFWENRSSVTKVWEDFNKYLERKR